MLKSEVIVMYWVKNKGEESYFQKKEKRAILNNHKDVQCVQKEKLSISGPKLLNV